MLTNSGSTTEFVPIGWFWGALTTHDLYWTALQYLWIWLFYLLISVPELIFWIMYMVEADMGLWLFNMWASYPGLYGGWVLYMFPAIIWPSVQLSVLAGDINRAGYTNAAVSMPMMMISWLFTGIVHVLGFPYLNRKADRAGAGLHQMDAKAAPAAG